MPPAFFIDVNPDALGFGGCAWSGGELLPDEGVSLRTHKGSPAHEREARAVPAELPWGLRALGIRR
jgi:hypothetical protein